MEHIRVPMVRVYLRWIGEKGCGPRNRGSEIKTHPPEEICFHAPRGSISSGSKRSAMMGAFDSGGHGGDFSRALLSASAIAADAICYRLLVDSNDEGSGTGAALWRRPILASCYTAAGSRIFCPACEPQVTEPVPVHSVVAQVAAIAVNEACAPSYAKPARYSCHVYTALQPRRTRPMMWKVEAAPACDVLRAENKIQ